MRHEADDSVHGAGCGRLAAAVTLALVVALCVLAPAAVAAEGHVLSQTFGAGELALGKQSELAIDQSAEVLYVADTGNGRVAKYTFAGAPAGTLVSVPEPTFIAVDNSGGASQGSVYVVNTGGTQVTKYDAAGITQATWGTSGTLTEPLLIAGIAVDPQGNLWILNLKGVFREYDPAGSQIAEASPFLLRQGAVPQGIAVDSSDNLYVAGVGRESARSFSKNGELLVFEYPGVGHTGALAIDSASDDLYVGAWYEDPGACLNGGVRRFHQETERNSRFEADVPLERFGNKCNSLELPDVSGIAVVSGTSEVFVASAGVIKSYPVEDVGPPTVSIDVPTAVTSTTAHVSGHINPEAPPGNSPNYDVEEWTFTCSPACPGVKSSSSIPADDQEHLVQGTLEELEPGTRYTITLSAVNVLNTAKAAVPMKTAPIAPKVIGETVGSVTTSEATLAAVLRPWGAPTTYHFEYLPLAAYESEGFAGAQTVSTPEAGPISEDAKEQAVSAPVASLRPSTPYVFRVVASNVAGTTQGPPQPMRTRDPLVASRTDCPNQPFRAGLGAFLPDCRAYEMASPFDKQGLSVELFQDYARAADDGSGVTYYSGAGTGIPGTGGGHQDFVTMLASRGAGSWSSQRLLAPESLGMPSRFLGASANLRYSLVEACRQGKEVAGSGCGLYLEDTAAETYTQLVAPEGSQGEAPQFPEGSYAYDSISADGSRVFFEGPVALTTNAATGEKPNLYMWDRATGQVSLVGVLPGAAAKAPTGGSFGGAYFWYGTGSPNLSLGGALAGQYVEAIHAIAEDGGSAYFTAGQTGQIYLRRNLGTRNPTTLQVSAPAQGISSPTAPAIFQEASLDGGHAFFLSSQRLTATAKAGQSESEQDLYRFDAANRSLVDVTPASAASSPGGAEVQGLLGASTDGRSGYLAAEGVLAPGATAGAANIYRFEEQAGSAFSYTFVATVPSTGFWPASRNWSPTSTGPRISPGLESMRNSRVTPDARALVYTAFGPGETPQLWLYSVGSTEPICVSCNPSGEPSVGPATLSTARLTAWLIPRGFIEQHITNNLSPDGTRLVFQTPDALVGADTNGANGCPGSRTENPRCEDVYEWEAPGAPGDSCHAAEVNGGCLYLLSGGKSPQPSNLIDGGVGEDDVFIATSSQLVPRDRDELVDVYDVGVDRGLASQQTVPTSPCTSGEGCAEGASSPGSQAPAGTSTFVGPGNPPAAKKCRKGFTRRHGRCVKTGKHHRKHHKKSKHGKKGKQHGQKAKSGKGRG